MSEETIRKDLEHFKKLRSAAAAIVDYAEMMSAKHSGSKFDITKSSEWVMRPDNWIRLAFSYTKTETIEISLGMPREGFQENKGLYIDDGLHPEHWTRVQVKLVSELPAAMDYVEQAFYQADSEFRKNKGKPKRPPARMKHKQRLEELSRMGLI